MVHAWRRPAWISLMYTNWHQICTLKRKITAANPSDLPYPVTSALASHPKMQNDSTIKRWGRWNSNALERYTRMSQKAKEHFFVKFLLALRMSSTMYRYVWKQIKSFLLSFRYLWPALRMSSTMYLCKQMKSFLLSFRYFFNQLSEWEALLYIPYICI
jgi:hypothetical protein